MMQLAARKQSCPVPHTPQVIIPDAVTAGNTVRRQLPLKQGES